MNKKGYGIKGFIDDNYGGYKILSYQEHLEQLQKENKMSKKEITVKREMLHECVNYLNLMLEFPCDDEDDIASLETLVDEIESALEKTK